MEERRDPLQRTSAWLRPSAGRKVSGLCLLFAERLGCSVRAMRVLWAADALVGLAMLLLFGVFDHWVAEDGLSGPVRALLAGLGACGLLSYPLLALLIPEESSPRRWDFGSALGALIVLTAMGQAVGYLLAPYWDAVQGRGEWAFGLKDLVLLAFFACSAAFAFLQRDAFRRFFRSMHVGVSLVVLTTLSVGLGVLVPQIDGFEDPEQRVDLARERADYELFLRDGYQKLPAALEDGNEQYQAFRWAEGYFLYHLYHVVVPFSGELPRGELGPTMEEGLERYGKRYGLEEEKNRRIQMTAAFSGQQKIDEIGAFIYRHEKVMWRAFEVCTLLHLNRIYKSSWFAALLCLLASSVFVSAYKGWRFRAERIPKAILGGVVAALFAVFLRATGALVIPWAPDFLLLVLAILGFAAVLGPGVPQSALSLQKLGFFVVHNGLLVLLLGGGVSKLTTVRGILQLDLRDSAPVDTFYRYFREDKKSKLPFGVRLDRFARRDWLALQVEFPEEGFTSRPPLHTLWEGKRLELDYVDDGEGGLRPDLVIDVLELHDKVDVGLVNVREREEPSEVPLQLAEVRVEGGEGDGRALLVPLRRARSTFEGEVLRDPENAWRLAAAWGPEPTARFPADGRRVGVLEWSVAGEGDGQPRPAEVRLGETIQVGGGYKVRFVQATSDFRTDADDERESRHPLPLEKQPLRFAALWVDLIPPGTDDEIPAGAGDQIERRVLFDAFDDVQIGRQEGFFHSGIVLRYRMDRWSSPGPPRYLIAWEPGGEPALLAEDGSRTPIEIGEALPLPGGRRVDVLQLLEDAHFESNLTFLAPTIEEDGWEADFYARAPRGAVLRVTRHPGMAEEGMAEEWSERVELATSDYGNAYLWFSPRQDVVLQFFENSEMLPFEWRSVLTIVERDNSGKWYEVPLGTEREREIRVNDYMYYDGYRLFQTNADSRVPTYSGIGVVYDPGIPLVLLGMYTVIAGGAIAFLLRPMLRGWGKTPNSSHAPGAPGGATT